MVDNFKKRHNNIVYNVSAWVEYTCTIKMI